MKNSRYILLYILLIFAQVLLWNFCTFSPLLTLVILPTMIIFLPVNQETVVSMILAFVIGFCSDFLADGMLGLSSFALVPVALSRKWVIRLMFGSEVFARNEKITLGSGNFTRTLVSMVIAETIFLACYIWADGAGLRPAGFNLLKLLVSLAAGILISLPVAILLDRESR